MFIINDKNVTNEEQIANHFNDFFASIGSSQASTIQSTHQNSYSQYLINPSSCRFQFDYVTPHEVSNIIQRFKPKSSTGFDNLSMKILKHITPTVCLPLSIMINQSFHSGVFPDLLKIAKVCPLFKKNDKSLLTNYRPISFTLLLKNL